MKSGIITKVAGPLVIAEGMRDADMFDVVRVSSQRLIGEIIDPRWNAPNGGSSLDFWFSNPP